MCVGCTGDTGNEHVLSPEQLAHMGAQGLKAKFKKKTIVSRFLEPWKIPLIYYDAAYAQWKAYAKN